jgi:hypothetical protein
MTKPPNKLDEFCDELDLSEVMKNDLSKFISAYELDILAAHEWYAKIIRLYMLPEKYFK